MKTRVLFTVDTISRSGIVNVVNNIASELKNDADFDVAVLCTGIIERNRMNTELKTFDLDISRYGHRKKYLYLVPSLKKFFQENDFDYVVVSGMEFVPFYYLAIGTSKMKMIAWEHLNFHAGPKYRLEWFGKRIACRYFYKVICITKKDAELYRNYCKKGEKIEQIYNVPYKLDPKGYKTDSRKIITVAYLGEYYKGYDLLVDTAAKVFAENDDWSWDIYGEGADWDKIQNRIDEYGLQEKVVLKGFADNIRDLYGDYSMFVLTSRVEGMGMVLVEAQYAELPVISFDIECGPSDVIADGENGYLIRPFDIEEMADKIKYLIDNEDKRSDMSAKSRMCLAEFDKEYIISKWRKVFGNI